MNRPTSGVALDARREKAPERSSAHAEPWLQTHPLLARLGHRAHCARPHHYHALLRAIRLVGAGGSRVGMSRSSRSTSWPSCLASICWASTLAWVGNTPGRSISSRWCRCSTFGTRLRGASSVRRAARARSCRGDAGGVLALGEEPRTAPLVRDSAVRFPGSLCELQRPRPPMESERQRAGIGVYWLQLVQRGSSAHRQWGGARAASTDFTSGSGAAYFTWLAQSHQTLAKRVAYRELGPLQCRVSFDGTSQCSSFGDEKSSRPLLPPSSRCPQGRPACVDDNFVRCREAPPILSRFF